MKHQIIPLFLFLVTFLTACRQEKKETDLKMWYDKPATDWYEALPIGNGTLGAMVYGGVSNETLQLNENTLYSGEPGDRHVDLDFTKSLPKVKELVKEGKLVEVEQIIGSEWMGRAQDCYQPFGHLYIDFDHEKTGWALEGKHEEIDCRECHFNEIDGHREQVFDELGQECYSCHDDNHGGQFEIGGITDCIRCHTSVNWKASLFDHNTTAFPLDGKHAEVECKECHPLIIVDGMEIVKYKLESFECIDCHF